MSLGADSLETVKSPLSPDESLKHFKLSLGLKIELVAAEPQVVDPVSIAFDEDGRLWVAEMSDYPNGPAPGEEPKSRIKLLEDKDHDGRYETAHVFADKLLFANGLQPWRGGVIVTMSGEIAYFKDTDGDHMADLRETWFRGFAQQNPQLRANHPRFALDNWIYVANGLRGGEIVANKEKWGKEYPPVNISGKDFRFNPFTGECEAVSGNGQFGMTFDDWGNRFICSNRNPCRHVVLEDRYLKRNPFLAVRDTCHDVSPPAEKSRVHPISRAWTTSTLHAGQFTAACGVLIYRGDALPENSYGNYFVCEPTGNLVHRERVSPSGATFSSQPSHADLGAEFLASPDEWFRPVDLSNGPDGALYVVDMYRAVIEHPEFVPSELKNRPDLRLGDDRGRIYRVVAGSSGQPPRPAPVALSQASSKDLVQSLAHPNGWRRDTASRLLNERQDKTVVPELQVMALTDKKETSRVHAMRALQGLGGINEDLLLQLLLEQQLHVREHAFVLTEVYLKRSPALLRRVINAGSDRRDPSDVPVLVVLLNDARTDFQQAFSLGEADSSPELIRRLGEIAVRNADDDWVRRAVQSAAVQFPLELFAEIISSEQLISRNTGQGALHLVREVSELIGSRQRPDEIAQASAALITLSESPPDNRKTLARNVLLSGLDGLGQGLARRGGSFAAMIAEIEKREPGAKEEFQKCFAQAVELAQDADAGLQQRQLALSVLQFGDRDVGHGALLAIAKSDREQDLRLRAIDVLGSFRDPTIGETLLADFTAQTPLVKRAILQAMIRDAGRTKQLLAAIADKRIPLTELDPTHVRTLTNHRDVAIRDLANKLLAAALPADRKQVLETYQKALALKADAKRGRSVFEKNCTQCHKIDNLGVDVAPDIADSRTKTPAQLLTDILSPNQAIDSNFVSYSVVTKAGKTFTGIIAAETASSITLRQPEGKTELILRQDIDELRSNGVSLMPDGLEKNITVEQMADLISFIKNWRYLDGAVPLGGDAGK